MIKAITTMLIIAGTGVIIASPAPDKPVSMPIVWQVNALHGIPVCTLFPGHEVRLDRAGHITFEAQDKQSKARTK